jgi:hypothetical protein
MRPRSVRYPVNVLPRESLAPKHLTRRWLIGIISRSPKRREILEVFP